MRYRGDLEQRVEGVVFYLRGVVAPAQQVGAQLVRVDHAAAVGVDHVEQRVGLGVVRVRFRDRDRARVRVRERVGLRVVDAAHLHLAEQAALVRVTVTVRARS